MLYSMDEYYRSLMDWELENKFRKNLIKIGLLRFLLIILFVCLVTVSLLMVFSMFSARGELSGQLTLIYVIKILSRPAGPH